MTQNNLGNALQTLGEREDGTVRLEEAVAAYRAALEVRTRERVPLDWAMTQNNLGNALGTLGEREDGTLRLEEAVAAYRGALEVFSAAGASYYVRHDRAQLARAEALLAERRGKRRRSERVPPVLLTQPAGKIPTPSRTNGAPGNRRPEESVRDFIRLGRRSRRTRIVPGRTAARNL